MRSVVIAVAALLAWAPVARAEEGERDSVKGESADAAHAAHEGHGGGEHGDVVVSPQLKGHELLSHQDLYQYFNFFDLDFTKKADLLGGPFGDGVNEDPKTHGILVDEHHEKINGKTYEVVAPAEEEKRSPAFVFMLLNFAVFAWIVVKFGGKAAQKLAAERHDEIKTALDEAAKLRDEAARKLAEYESKLKASDDEIKKLVDGMRADAEADKKRILAAAETQAAQMKRDAEARIAAELMYARAALTKDVTNAAAAAAERILREKLQPADQQQLVTKFVASLDNKEAR